MSTSSNVNHKRRQLIVASSVVSGVGVAGALIPLAASLLPSKQVAIIRETSQDIEIDISTVLPGQMISVAWQGKPVWVLNRTPEMLATLTALENSLADPYSEKSQQPDNCTNQTRSIQPAMLVVIGICTHARCTPQAKFKTGTQENMAADWLGGFWCACHASSFDLAGRVFKNKLAPVNLNVPPHRYLSETRLLIGETISEDVIAS